MINKAPEYQAAVAAREEIVDIQAQLAEAAVHLSIRDARVEELRIQRAEAQKEIKQLREEFDAARLTIEALRVDDNRLRWMLAWTTLELEKAANTRFDELKGWMGQLDFPNLDLAHVILDGEVE